MTKHGEGSESKFKRTLSERVVAYVSLLLVASLLGYLFYAAVLSSDLPADIVLTVEQIESSGDDYLVRFSARNKGEQTAASVKIKGELFVNNKEVEQASVTLQYLAPKSQADGSFYFQRDPRQADLRLQVVGYRHP